jgi:hypothetical protein
VYLPFYFKLTIPEDTDDPVARKTYLCLIDGGKQVEAYEITKELFMVFKQMRGDASRPLAELLQSIPEKKSRNTALRAIQEIYKMGVLSHA